MSNTPRYQSLNGSISTQKGAVLIVVLLFLVLIILVGVIAVKQSTTDLRLATSDQINTLLLQSADNANQNIEQGVNGSSDADVYTDMLSRTGPFGHFILDTNSTEHEYVFCFRPRGRFFDINKTTINTKDGNILGNDIGYCNPSTAADYISDRNASMTQVNISLTAPSANNEVFSSYTVGQDSSEISSQAFMFDINSTAILPAYSGKADAAKDCFKKTSRVGTVEDDEDAIGGCMIEEGVPSTVLYEMANVENLSMRKNCVDFGKGAGVVCTLPTS
ncbi:PilX N-terminal domain-containing pilus assembly protein [Psychrobacter sp. ANT_H3]|uniref:PilX N-terminal domain-containing pilus assembly protein n=1 Tax=Psychrobacter sp. ANT_H3 TaxID=3019444 RepID=UPI0022F18269|nr:PilX N-terminal domain-containing pilus assembly protein [Psychrobacter sp. ANT_H3]MDA5133801.1 PilX N-terminal domain-containing pilus assembly protein [Psychrobacter sp. ANT_H3]